MKPRTHIPCIFLLIAATCGLGAQDQNQNQPPAQETTSESPSPTLKANPLEALRNFQPAEDEEYRLGKGDEINVDFAGRPDLV